jgi:uncharacterized HAD superfamily protein/adenine/guanine phosphoribosyltransferase-like PRPP-binding protein
VSLNVRSFADLNLAIANNLHRIDRDSFDVIVGIPRSGMLVATLLATHMQKPLADVEGYLMGLSHKRYNIRAGGNRILLVDDSCNKGRAMSWAVSRVRKRAQVVTRLVVYGPYQLSNPQEVCDIWLEECQGPRVFQWNMWKHIRLPRWSFDFDGVFCRDPTNEENDDGPKYQKFIETTQPLFVPERPIGHIITGRLEKYRESSVKWLKKHGIAYGTMHMMPYATKAERMAAGGRGGWKAKTFMEIGSEFFIESNPKQAGIITKLSGKPVWCTSTQSFFGEKPQ